MVGEYTLRWNERSPTAWFHKGAVLLESTYIFHNENLPGFTAVDQNQDADKNTGQGYTHSNNNASH